MSNRAGIVGTFILEIIAATLVQAAPTGRIKADLLAKPLSFELNQGQTDPRQRVRCNSTKSSFWSANPLSEV